ncbi:hypothetical protein A2955_03825 [Candidatus Woesebacteria bacterium RIFCSPLOWO2_01_FULL_37_19]|uniref:Uncharacterized protein n=2 Tax=Candidatus Woeseibacteriota TaxID=1752722 RepID=A0A1F8AY15_9BACT|nr:MAG: hypothetical protein A2771_02395 [Candidatus Woesebacteria bacterium RIFCSPHIGHO2_01_FULL_38_26b]OGM56631.1 MAG: hypothetical protein A2955_03825 [Candidatus Woesebacteria bacterium RIFCSPLOWO2_01_FULL_37_19]
MYSEKLANFISQNRPEEVQWSEEEIRDLVIKAGLEYQQTRSFDGKVFRQVISRGKDEDDFKILSLPLSIKWEIRFEGSLLVFEPKLSYNEGWFKGPSPDPAQLLLEASGLAPVRIELPESVVEVTLPIPPCVRFYSPGWDGIIQEPFSCFHSELGEMVEVYIVELRQAAGHG